jgi:hypothetical protein
MARRRGRASIICEIATAALSERLTWASGFSPPGERRPQPGPTRWGRFNPECPYVVGISKPAAPGSGPAAAPRRCRFILSEIRNW